MIPMNVPQLQSQIVDLRSAVCKEACRTVATLAVCLGAAFSPLAEQFWASLLRVVAVKIQVMNSAADRCVRALVALCPETRLLAQILESCAAKNSQIRKFSLECLSLSAALWKPELLERCVWSESDRLCRSI